MDFFKETAIPRLDFASLKFRFAYYYNIVEDIEWVNLATVSSKELIVCL